MVLLDHNNSDLEREGNRMLRGDIEKNLFIQRRAVRRSKILVKRNEKVLLGLSLQAFYPTRFFRLFPQDHYLDPAWFHSTKRTASSSDGRFSFNSFIQLLQARKSHCLQSRSQVSQQPHPLHFAFLPP